MLARPPGREHCTPPLAVEVRAKSTPEQPSAYVAGVEADGLPGAGAAESAPPPADPLPVVEQLVAAAREWGLPDRYVQSLERWGQPFGTRAAEVGEAG